MSRLKPMSKSMAKVLIHIRKKIEPDQWFDAEDIPGKICGHNSLNILRGLKQRGYLISKKSDQSGILENEKFQRL